MDLRCSQRSLGSRGDDMTNDLSCTLHQVMRKKENKGSTQATWESRIVFRRRSWSSSASPWHREYTHIYASNCIRPIVSFVDQCIESLFCCSFSFLILLLILCFNRISSFLFLGKYARLHNKRASWYDLLASRFFATLHRRNDSLIKFRFLCGSGWILQARTCCDYHLSDIVQAAWCHRGRSGSIVSAHGLDLCWASAWATWLCDALSGRRSLPQIGHMFHVEETSRTISRAAARASCSDHYSLNVASVPIARVDQQVATHSCRS